MMVEVFVGVTLGLLARDAILGAARLLLVRAYRRRHDRHMARQLKQYGHASWSPNRAKTLTMLGRLMGVDLWGSLR
jgi:hypothetical protein